VGHFLFVSLSARAQSALIRSRHLCCGGVDLPLGDELAVLDGVFVLQGAIIDRAQGAVGLASQAVFAGLPEAREIHAQISSPSPETSGRRLAFIRRVAEIAAVHDPPVRRDLQS